MAIDWDNPDPIDSATWTELAHALASRRIPVFQADGFQAAPQMPVVRERLCTWIFGLIKSSVDSGIWRKDDCSVLTWRDVVSSAQALPVIPQAATPFLRDSHTVEWLKAAATAIKMLRYRAGSFDVGDGWRGVGQPNTGSNRLGGTSLADVIEIASVTPLEYDKPDGAMCIWRLPVLRRAVTTATPGSPYLPGAPYGFADYWRGGEITAVAPCPWAVPTTITLVVTTPADTGMDHLTYDPWGTDWDEGLNTIPATDRIRQAITEDAAAPDAPGTDGTLAWRGNEVIGWDLDACVYDYGDNLIWTPATT